MRSKFIAVCTPTLGQVSIEWASCLRALALPLNYGYLNFFVVDDQGGEIAETRNRCVQLALDYESDKHEVTHLFWLDDDVIFSRMALLKLFQHNRDIASGVYFTKCEPSEPLIFPGRGCGTSQFVPEQAFETWGHGMGLTLIKTEVYKKMKDDLNLPRDKYGRPEWYKTTGAEHFSIEDEVMWLGGTEDLYFLHNAQKVGFKPFVDTSRLAFGWHFDKKSRQGYPIKQWNQRMKGKPVTWNTPNGEVTWN